MSFNDNDTATLVLPADKRKSSVPFSNTEYRCEYDCDIGNLQSMPSPVPQRRHSGATEEEKGESSLTCSGSNIVVEDAHGGLGSSAT
ncbi:hypothetical protein DPMN_060610 [Dreissena polymorpha]|uniref:Uncharacterized protein n=1 Tax=Dreissena polymorpha TaxID=45954 RepID=A0A9D4HHN5_DREPO|nr:hypothetical protein DPMN_060610 [Dreissena polymorpha]